MKKIIHFSDLHIGYKNLAERFQCIVGNVIFLKEPADQYVIIITGDLVDNATDPNNYERAQAYVNTLRDAGFTVLVVPGNHDYGTGSFGSKKYVKHFKETFFGNSNITYPKVDIIDKIAFIGLDSMAEELHFVDRLFANGELGKDQLQRLENKLSDPIVTACDHRVIYLHHHPWDSKGMLHELKDAHKFGELLKKKDNIDALLYGHMHEGKRWNGKWNIKRCYDAGSSTRKDNRIGEYLSEHRVIDFYREPGLDYDAYFHCNELTLK